MDWGYSISIFLLNGTKKGTLLLFFSLLLKNTVLFHKVS